MSTSQRVSRGFHRFGRLFVTRILAAVVLTVILTGDAAAGPLEDAYAASERGDYATAFGSCGRWPSRAMPKPRPFSASLTMRARASRRTTPRQRRGYRLAADQGFVPAHCNLGLMYENGQGVPQTTPRQRNGFAVRLSRAMPEPSSISGLPVPRVSG
jgi:hypothetical protein